MSKSLAGTVVDGSVKMSRGWEPERARRDVILLYVGLATNRWVQASERKPQIYAPASELPLSPAFRGRTSSCACRSTSRNTQGLKFGRDNAEPDTIL